MTQYNLGRVTPIFQGDYDPKKSYECLDVVLFNGSSYVAKTDTLGNEPSMDSKFWQMVASAGTGGGGGTCTVDSELSTESINPVQNKVITLKINQLESLIIPKSTIQEIIENYQYQTAEQVEQAIVSKNYQTAGQVEQAITGKGYQNADQVEQAITGKGYQNADQVESAITGKGYQNADQVESAITGKGYQNAEQVSQTVETVITEKNYVPETSFSTINGSKITQGGNLEIKSGGIEIVTVNKEFTYEEMSGWGPEYTIPNFEDNKFYIYNFTYPTTTPDGSLYNAEVWIRFNNPSVASKLLINRYPKPGPLNNDIKFTLKLTKIYNRYNCWPDFDLPANSPYLFDIFPNGIALLPDGIDGVYGLSKALGEKANNLTILSYDTNKITLADGNYYIEWYTQPIVDQSQVLRLPDAKYQKYNAYYCKFIFTTGPDLTTIDFTDETSTHFKNSITVEPNTQYFAIAKFVVEYNEYAPSKNEWDSSRSNFTLFPLNNDSGSGITPEQVQEIINQNTAGFQTSEEVEQSIITKNYTTMPEVEAKGYTTLETVNQQGFAKSSEIPTDNANLTNGAGYVKKVEIATINNQSITNGGNITIEGGGAAVTVDSQLSTESENPVQNKVLTTKINEIEASIPTDTVTAQEVETAITSKGYTTLEAVAQQGYALNSDIPTNNNQLDNGANYTTMAAVEAKGYKDEAGVNELIDAKTSTFQNAEQVQEIINTNTAGFQTDANVKATIKTNPEGFAKSSEIPTDNATLTNGAGYQTDAQVKATLTANPDGYAKTTDVDTKLSKKADSTRVDAIVATIPDTTEAWSFTMEDGSTVTKNVYIE